MKLQLWPLVMLLSLMSFNGLAQQLSYPELQVTPRASARIKLEIRAEAGHAWTSYMPVQISALSTLAAASMMGSSVDTEKDENEVSPKIGMVFGAAWLGATVWASMKYRPYRKSFSKYKKYPKKTKRQQLTFERLAEEELSSLRTLGKRIRWFSFVTNLVAAGYMQSSAKEDSDGQRVSGVAALLAFGPLFFNFHWEDVANEQDKYKKKIYAPVAMTPIIQDPFTLARATGVNLLFTF